MPSLKDAPVLLGGQVIDTTIRRDPKTDQVTSRDVTVMVPEQSGPGFAVVKIKGEDIALINPNHYENVLWMVRPAPYDISDGDRRNTGMSVRFLRQANENDLDLLASYAKNAAPSK